MMPCLVPQATIDYATGVPLLRLSMSLQVCTEATDQTLNARHKMVRQPCFGTVPYAARNISETHNNL